jgi:hypothetical protein
MRLLPTLLALLLKLLVLVACWAAVGSSALAQTAVVAGTVADEAGLPLPGVHVFVEGTTSGDVTAPDGRFRLSVLAPRSATIRASSIGYQPQRQSVDLKPGDTLAVRFVLATDTLVAGGVEVSAERDRTWMRRLRQFTRVLLGLTDNADQARIVNTAAVEIEPSGPDTYVAWADQPLLVRNPALGYDVILFDLDAEFGPATWGWDAGVFFRDLCAPDCPAEIIRQRFVAYAGSLDHFVRSAIDGTLEQDGFKVDVVAEPGDEVYAGTRLMRAFGIGRRAPFEMQPSAEGWWSPVDGALWVQYVHERLPDGWPQKSWLTVEGDTLRVGEGRSIVATDQYVLRHGWWSYERLADLLPTDYDPRRGY